MFGTKFKKAPFPKSNVDSVVPDVVTSMDAEKQEQPVKLEFVTFNVPLGPPTVIKSICCVSVQTAPALVGIELTVSVTVKVPGKE